MKAMKPCIIQEAFDSAGWIRAHTINVRRYVNGNPFFKSVTVNNGNSSPARLLQKTVCTKQ
jgi:hypothetical protein